LPGVLRRWRVGKVGGVHASLLLAAAEDVGRLGSGLRLKERGKEALFAS